MATKLMTLCIVHQDNRILLGMKKRGFGEGRWNGFGGKVMGGEGIEEAVRREMKEECDIEIGDIEKLGVLDFEFAKDRGNFLQVHIFKSNDFLGEPKESEEMFPQWYSVDEIPFEKMWSDDPYWLPLFLENKKFKGRFLFDDNDNILEKELSEVTSI